MTTVTVGSVTFEDPHRWLRHESADVLAWQEKQDSIARTAIRSWPGFDALRASMSSTSTVLTTAADQLGTTTPRRLGSYWFRLAPVAADELGLWVSDSPAERGRLLVAPRHGSLYHDSKPAQLLWYEPTPDGERVLFATYYAGATAGVLRVVETRSGHITTLDAPPHLFVGTVPGWLPDGSGFYLADRTDRGDFRITFIPVVDEVPPRPEVLIGAHELPASAAGLTPQVSPDGRQVIVVSGQHEQIACRISDLVTGTWRGFLPDGYSGECHGVWYDDTTYIAVVTGDAAHGRVVAIPVATSTRPDTWRELVPESEAILRCVTYVDNKIVLCELRDGAVRFRIFDEAGRLIEHIPLPGYGTSPTAFVTRRFERSAELTFSYSTFTQHTTHYRYDTRIGDSSAELTGMVTERRVAISQDGTRIPYFVVRRSDLDHELAHPALICAYGGFNVAWLPRFLGNYAPFLDAGGVYIHANLRGGAEFGRAWYESGRLRHKQNTFDDLHAVAEDLIATGLSTADKMAFHGHSNGGLLAGVAMTQRPDLWRAIVAESPALDMMEPLAQKNSGFAAAIRSVYAEDYGDPERPGDSETIYAYSPYHNIRAGAGYPALLQTFGENDLGCPPFHGRRFTARLHAEGSGGPFLLRVWKNAGHAAVTHTMAAEQATEILAFLMRELDMTPCLSAEH